MRDPLGDHDYLVGTPASKTLLPGYFQAAHDTLTKKEYYLVGERMTKEEVAPEIRKKLDEIMESLGIAT